ncbi:ABC transporter ATP-binding protein [Microlunatus parietis]|uniref:ABC-2 type transport system ATP-binding protein n=1 Tax=Microlunatus parietis TaxID=682979 RepID=A0A7Y9LE86_9ACTN|nr:ATP-binding cassette domain-containing protein [Microlunatus parietis]NYE72796.1 ABC-2 type transport system ATP-binding protein [Microlunatus parietis]
MTGIAIRVDGLTKVYGSVRAVDDVTFSAEPGRITGFLGPNGAGKSTTLRMLLGLVRPDAGTARFNGRAYRDLPNATATVGAVVDLAAAHPATTARGHLRTYAALGGHPATRVAEVITTTGIDGFADRRVGGYSTGMKQRLALATALLGEPRVLVLDEPSNGLDPAGIVWLRNFLRDFAAAGRTVLISSHLLTEVQHSVDDVVLINNGRIAWAGPLTEVTAAGGTLEETFLSITQEGALR